MAEQLKPGDYIGLYIDNNLIYTGVLKDQGVMQRGRKVYQILLVKNIEQMEGNVEQLIYEKELHNIIG